MKYRGHCYRSFSGPLSMFWVLQHAIRYLKSGGWVGPETRAMFGVDRAGTNLRLQYLCTISGLKYDSNCPHNCNQ